MNFEKKSETIADKRTNKCDPIVFLFSEQCRVLEIFLIEVPEVANNTVSTHALGVWGKWVWILINVVDVLKTKINDDDTLFSMLLHFQNNLD